MRFKSGMLGCCVVVLALLGTVLGGFVLGIEPSTREVTTYDYVTDVTGLFDITDAPEYVTYSPSSNLVGYSPSSAINYTTSSTVNSYRYLVQEGIEVDSTATITDDDNYPSDTGRFPAAEMGTQAMINWNGSYNFGSTVTWQGITYNSTVAGETVQVGEFQSSMPRITSLSRVIQSLNLGNYNSLDISITYGSMPIIFYNGSWTFTNIEREDGYTQYVYSATLNDNNTMPTSMRVNLATNTVIAFRGDSQMWNVNADQVDVIYRYSTRAGGSFSPADSSATFNITAHGYPTYGYMDPTKGITMTSGTLSATYTFPADINPVYDLAQVFPREQSVSNTFAYLYSYDGWGGNWSGSVTLMDYTLQGIAPRNPDGWGIAMQTLKKGMIEPFGLTDTSYGTYTIDLTHGAFPIYIGKLGLNGLPLNFMNVGQYVDPNAHTILGIRYLETSWNPQIDRLVYESTTDTVSAYTRNGDNYTLQWTDDADHTWMIPMYYLLDSSLQNISPTTDAYYVNPAPVNTTVSISAERSTVATWSNGYKNDVITMSIQRENFAGNDLTITAGTSTVTITTNMSGYMTATINGVIRDIGQWKNLQLTISAVEGTLSLTPLANSISFTAPSNPTNATIVIDGWYTGDPIESLSFSTSGQSLRWQITQTTVFLDTFNAVMFNPSIKITDFFPDVDEWRLNFYSFAIYGNTMTINNTLFNVDRTSGKVSFTLDDNNYTLPLQNIYITNQEVGVTEHIFLTFQNNKTVFDLGETVDGVVSFTGLWYFTTGFYKAVTTTESYYDWQLDGLWHITSSQTLVIFIGLLGVGLLVLKGVFGVSVKSIDGIVIIVACVIGVMMVV